MNKNFVINKVTSLTWAEGGEEIDAVPGLWSAGQRSLARARRACSDPPKHACPPLTPKTAS